MKKYFVLLFALIIALTAFTGCRKEDSVTKQSFFFDTVVNITVSKKDTSAVTQALKLCGELENTFSRTKESSELWNINNGQTDSLSEDMKTVLEFSLYMSELSGGSFDITIGSLVDLWDIKNRTTGNEISSAKEKTGYTKVTLSPFSQGGTTLDMGAVAKGYAADRIISLLKENGVESAIIDLGGNVALIGEFSVGIRSPFNPDELYAKIVLKDKSAVTSGAYQRYFEYKGTRYHHIIDPRSGYCAESGIASVTVISPSSMQADALSTAIFVMGKDGISLCDNFDETDAFIIMENGEVITTEGFNEKYSAEILISNK